MRVTFHYLFDLELNLILLIFKYLMKLRYSGNIMPFEDSMKKVSAITWSPSGKKLAVGAADRVLFLLFSRSISSMRTDKRKISSPPSLLTKARSHIS